MGIKMKLNKKNIEGNVLALLLLPFFVIFTILIMLYLPFDYIKYKKSKYYKDTHKKYEWLAGMTDEVKFYDFIKDNNLDIEHITVKTKELENVSYFVYKDILIVTDALPYFSEKKGKWLVIADENEESEDNDYTLEDYLNIYLDEFNQQVENKICEKVVALLDEGDYKEDIIKREYNDNIIFYNKKNMKEKIVEGLKIINN